MKLHKIAAASITVLAAALSVCSSANASLVLVGPAELQGTGLGAVSTVLTIQSPANSTSETGSVGRMSGNPNDVITGDAKTGASQTLTRSIADVGLTSAAELRLIFNALEPGGADNSILLSNLVLSIYDPTTGALLFNSGAFTPINFPTTTPGAGKPDFVFRLDDQQAAAAQATGFGSPTNLIGLSATANDATGGFETFFLARGVVGGGGGPGGTPIPEPATLALVGLGLFGAASARRRKQ